jgi:hypothetical protein
MGGNVSGQKSGTTPYRIFVSMNPRYQELGFRGSQENCKTQESS